MRILFSILVVATFLYLYIHKYNQLIELRLNVPKLKGELEQIQDVNAALTVEVEKQMSPDRLIKLLTSHDYSYLVFPGEANDQ